MILVIFGRKIAGVLVLFFLWVELEGHMAVNGYTLLIITTQLAEHINECWIAVGNPHKNNHVERILLTVQKLNN